MMSDNLPDGWIETTLGEVTKIIGGGTPTSTDPTNFTTDGGIPWITPSDLSGYKKMYIDKGTRNLTEKGLRESSAKILPAGSVLFSSRAPIGYVAIATNEVTTNQGFKSFALPNGLDNRFIYFYLKHIKPVAEMMATGTTFKELSGANTAKLPLQLPPLPEQTRIADKLDTLLARVDSCQAHLSRVPQLLKRFRQSVLKAACEGRLVSQDSSEGIAKELLQTILENRKQKLKKYKEPLDVDFSELDYVPSLPQNWTWVTLDQLTWSVKDGPHYSPQYTDDGIPFISGGNVRPNGIDFENAKRISPELHAELSKRVKPEKGDILYTKGGTTGIARVNTYDIDFNVWVHVAVLKLCSPVNVFYLQHALNSEFCYNQAQKYTHGVGNQDLGLTRMIKIAIPLPPQEEQRRIVRRVEVLFALADRLEARWRVAQGRVGSLTPSLLAKAFRGELVPQDAEDESAEKLIEKIRTKL